MNFLLIDFGASRIKSIIYNAAEKKFFELYSTKGSFMHGSNITSLDFFYKSFLDHLKYQSIKFPKIDAINICSEMHGFVMSENNRNLLDESYISWRSTNKNFTEKQLQDFFPNNNFKEITGMQYRDGLPVSNIYSYSNYSKKYRFIGLCESLIEIHGKWFGKMSKNMAAASGLYDINKKCWIKMPDSMPKVDFPNISESKKNIYGVIDINKKEVPVYGCIGDLQASLLSIDLKDSTVNVNLGTGSQVSKHYKKGDEENFELRPIFDENYFTTISHIPCGRVLDLFSKLFDQISELNGGKKGIFWELFLSKSKIDESNLLNIDLNFFKGSYNYKTGGLIKNINENSFYLVNLIDSIKFSLVSQYSDVIKSMQLQSRVKFDEILITGALAKNIEDFGELLSKQTGIKTEIIDHKYDATLIGLSKLSDCIYKK